MYDEIIRGRKQKQSILDDVYRWFARYLLEGKVFSKLRNLLSMLNDPPAIITVSILLLLHLLISISHFHWIKIMIRDEKMLPRCIY